MVAPTGGGDFTLGVSSGMSTAEMTLPTDSNFGDVVAVEIASDLDTGIGSLTAGGHTVSGSKLGAGKLIDTFIFAGLIHLQMRRFDSTTWSTAQAQSLSLLHLAYSASGF